ncbi:MAG TPA: zinc-dependent metalloprotease family protein [Candidatus Saccharimonadales bacterium]|nr:zinc-dependent metalloprotease family protein [Candidatus Saccharimonadales bacterium]
MPFDIHLAGDASVDTFRIVPARFARAVRGFSQIAAPDVDDHGFTPASPFGQAHGPAVGVLRNRTIRVRVVRDRLETTAPIFATSDDPSIASIEFPPDGQALNPADIPASGTDPARAGDCVFIRGDSAASNTAETKVKIRHGSNTGPVLAELAVLVYPILLIRVQAHEVVIRGTGPAGFSLANVQRLFDRVNDIYAQAGIQFRVNGTLLTENLVNAGGTPFATAGFVTLTATRDDQNMELQTVLNTRPVANSLNAYFVPGYRDIARVPPEINGTLGIAFSRNAANASPPNAGTGFPGCEAGITVLLSGNTNTVAHTAAHEIGHSLTLEHYNNKNPPGPGDSHIWGTRCLMHNFVSVGGFDIGYGATTVGTGVSAGQLLMIKKRAKIFQSDQVNVMRRAFLNNQHRPLRGT